MAQTRRSATGNTAGKTVADYMSPRTAETDAVQVVMCGSCGTRNRVRGNDPRTRRCVACLATLPAASASKPTATAAGSDADPGAGWLAIAWILLTVFGAVLVYVALVPLGPGKALPIAQALERLPGVPDQLVRTYGPAVNCAETYSTRCDTAIPVVRAEGWSGRIEFESGESLEGKWHGTDAALSGLRGRGKWYLYDAHARSTSHTDDWSESIEVSPSTSNVDLIEPFTPWIDVELPPIPASELEDVRDASARAALNIAYPYPSVPGTFENLDRSLERTIRFALITPEERATLDETIAQRHGLSIPILVLGCLMLAAFGVPLIVVVVGAFRRA